MIKFTVISLPTLEELYTLKYKCNNICASLSASVPSAVSSMLERLCPRLMPLTAGGRSTLEPLSWGVEDVTSGGTLFSGGEKKVTVNENNSQQFVLCIHQSYLSVKTTNACEGQYISQH